MISISQTEFRDHMGKYLAAAQRGEEVEIRRRGKPVAIVKPIRRQGIPSWKNPRELLKLPSGVSASRLIIEEREEGW